MRSPGRSFMVQKMAIISPYPRLLRVKSKHGNSKGKKYHFTEPNDFMDVIHNLYSYH